MERFSALVLAAGNGKRIKSNKPKVLHKILGKSIINHILDSLVEAGINDINLVIGANGDLVKADVDYDVNYAYQEKQLGTGHATLCAKEILNTEYTLVMYGDTPLIKGDTLSYLLKKADRIKADALILTTIADNPSGQGFARVIRKGFSFEKIVQEEDATALERKCKEVSGGITVFKTSSMFKALEQIDNKNENKEYYITDCINKMKADGGHIETVKIDDSWQIFGVNTREQLAKCVAILKNRINAYHMANGVTIIDPNTTYIGKYVKIGIDTTIYPNTYIFGDTEIGENVVIGTNTEIHDSKISDACIIKQSTIVDSDLGKEVSVGPYAHIRPNSKLGDRVKIGDFVEIKNSSIGTDTTASHHAYIGDSEVGNSVNFGCGSVVVNFDGKNKHRSSIKDGAFIGCNANLISPVSIGEKAFIAAGSTITDDVEADSLAIARNKQENIENWVKNKK